jgi:hypothetical protein
MNTMGVGKNLASTLLESAAITFSYMNKQLSEKVNFTRFCGYFATLENGMQG